MDEKPLPLEYESPDQRKKPPREYRGCLVPIAIAIGMVGFYFRLLERPDTPRDEDRALFRLLGFIIIAVVVAIIGLVRRKSN